MKNKIIAVFLCALLAFSFAGAALAEATPDAPDKTASEVRVYNKIEYQIEGGEVTILGFNPYAVSIVDVNIPDYIDGCPVTYISKKAFDNCRSIKTVHLPSTLKIIDAQAFEKCINMTRINFPEGLEKIEATAFYHCEALTSIKLPESLYWLGFDAFRCCYALETANVPGKISESFTGE